MWISQCRWLNRRIMNRFGLVKMEKLGIERRLLTAVKIKRSSIFFPEQKAGKIRKELLHENQHFIDVYDRGEKPAPYGRS
jgi:hypothetical protein